MKEIKLVRSNDPEMIELWFGKMLGAVVHIDCLYGYIPGETLNLVIEEGEASITTNDRG